MALNAHQAAIDARPRPYQKAGGRLLIKKGRGAASPPEVGAQCENRVHVAAGPREVEAVAARSDRQYETGSTWFDLSTIRRRVIRRLHCRVRS